LEHILELIHKVTSSPYLDYIILSAIVWIAYGYVIKHGGFVSDDLSGIQGFDGILQTTNDADKNLPTSKKILKSEYGMISRWLRYTIVGGNFPSKHKDPRGIAIPQGKIPARHHALSVIVFNIAVLFLYHWLTLITTPQVALLTTALFIVHPIGTQSIAWCSGLGYPLCLFWMSVTLNFVFWSKSVPSDYQLFVMIGFCALQFFGIHAMFTAMMLWTVLLFFGYWQFAVLGFLISIVMGLDIIKQTVGMRVAEFKKQQMGQSTVLNWRKIVVALKTLHYYIGHVIFPNRMGLYHTYGFHYSKDMERTDSRFWGGFLIFCGLVCVFLISPWLEIKLGILWFIAFVWIFLNWITIQQFITERYIFIPSIGVCLIIAFLTKDYPVVYALIFGGYLVRTWMQLPTYDNELRFYQSNHWQFPTSEVALGNLGVTYMNYGLPGASMDAWKLGASINPDYDVSWYNIFSSMRTEAMTAISHGDFDNGIAKLRSALPMLEKCINAKTCHFPDVWKKEYNELANAIKNPLGIVVGEHKRLADLLTNLYAMRSQTQDPKRIAEIEASINDTHNQIKHSENYLTQRGGVQTLTEQSLLSKILKG